MQTGKPSKQSSRRRRRSGRQNSLPLLPLCLLLLKLSFLGLSLSLLCLPLRLLLLELCLLGFPVCILLGCLLSSFDSHLSYSEGANKRETTILSIVTQAIAS